MENNALSGLDGFGTGFQNNVQAQGALVNNTNLTDENGKVLNPATPEQIKYASDKLVTGELPAGQNAATGLLTAWGAGFGTLGGATIGKGVERLQTTIPQFTIPKITGAVAESTGSEYLASSAQNPAEKVQQKLEKKNDEK